MADVKKNQVTVLIEDCRFCPNMTLKFDEDSEEDIMYCQTAKGLIMLRDNGWGPRPIPDWCPRLTRKKNLCGKRAEIHGLLS